MPTRRITMTLAPQTAPMDKAIATVAGAEASIPANPSSSSGSDGVPGPAGGGAVAGDDELGGGDEVTGADGSGTKPAGGSFPIAPTGGTHGPIGPASVSASVGMGMLGAGMLG